MGPIKKIAQQIRRVKKQFWGLLYPIIQKIKKNPIWTSCRGIPVWPPDHNTGCLHDRFDCISSLTCDIHKEFPTLCCLPLRQFIILSNQGLKIIRKRAAVATSGIHLCKMIILLYKLNVLDALFPDQLYYGIANGRMINKAHSTKKPVTTMLTYPWKCTVLHCNHLGNTWKPLVLMTRHFDYCPSANEGDNQSVRSSAPVVSRCFPGGYNVKLYISRGRLAWWLLAFLHSVELYTHRLGRNPYDTDV